jgi:hypothetical protein
MFLKNPPNHLHFHSESPAYIIIFRETFLKTKMSIFSPFYLRILGQGGSIISLRDLIGVRKLLFNSGSREPGAKVVILYLD